MVWIKEVMPEEWDTRIKCLIYKKGNEVDSNNYRGITLLNTLYNILTSIISERIKQFAYKI